MAAYEISEINKMLIEDPQGTVLRAEAEYHDRIEGIADRVVNGGKIRVLLLAGPSGSGKTTTANLLKDALLRRGEECLVVSLDDFYRDANDPSYPKNSDGERDFECPESLHLDEIAVTVGAICEGAAFNLPKYDFKQGKRVSVTAHSPMPHGCVIIEGLHALNPKLAHGVDKEKTLKIFVSVSTNILSKGEVILSGRKIRFIRRMVRDSLYRGADAARTLDMWMEVLLAEDVYLYPYRDTADIAFDTFHSFELGATSSYVERLISDSFAKEHGYARVVAEAARQVAHIDEALIPDDSLVREFIPGGKYEAVY